TCIEGLQGLDSCDTLGVELALFSAIWVGEGGSGIPGDGEPHRGAIKLTSSFDDLQGFLFALRRMQGDESVRLDEDVSGPLADVAHLINRMADRMIDDRQALAANIRSLDETNRELRTARDQVVRSARLASAGTLAAGIAHEVGNPLGAIMGFADLALVRAEGEGENVELLESIRDEARRIDQIVRGLLDYARPERNEVEEMPVAEVIQYVRSLLEHQGQLTEVDLSIVIESGGAEPIAYPDQLQQVLVNLLLNALHAVGDVSDPHILVRVFVEDGRLTAMPSRRVEDPPEVDYMHRRRRDVDAESPAAVSGAERVLAIEVTDNGSGLPPDTIENLFDPFFTTKAPGEGTGLGLSICARLVEGMGGTIDAANRDFGGARFVIRLPATEPFDEPEPESATETS
ncbi:MAG: sensor histidine kinase, partial [Longimicrobiales bacterium]